MTTGAQFVEEARTWIGTPWKHAQACKGAGCDCIGLVGGVAAAAGVTNAWLTDASREFKGYGREPDERRILAGCDRWMTRISKAELQLGDILVMEFAGRPMHFGIVSCLDPLRMIHGYAQARKVAENGVVGEWWNRIVMCYRLKGID